MMRRTSRKGHPSFVICVHKSGRLTCDWSVHPLYTVLIYGRHMMNGTSFCSFRPTYTIGFVVLVSLNQICPSKRSSYIYVCLVKLKLFSNYEIGWMCVRACPQSINQTKPCWLVWLLSPLPLFLVGIYSVISYTMTCAQPVNYIIIIVT